MVSRVVTRGGENLFMTDVALQNLNACFALVSESIETSLSLKLRSKRGYLKFITGLSFIFASLKPARCDLPTNNVVVL